MTGKRLVAFLRNTLPQPGLEVTTIFHQFLFTYLAPTNNYCKKRNTSFSNTFSWPPEAQSTDVSQQNRQNLGAHIYFCCGGPFHFNRFLQNDNVRFTVNILPLGFSNKDPFSDYCFTKPSVKLCRTQTVRHNGPQILLTGFISSNGIY